VVAQGPGGEEVIDAGDGGGPPRQVAPPQVAERLAEPAPPGWPGVRHRVPSCWVNGPLMIALVSGSGKWVPDKYVIFQG
jgi:hypothetical protein